MLLARPSLTLTVVARAMAVVALLPAGVAWAVIVGVGAPLVTVGFGSAMVGAVIIALVSIWRGRWRPSLAMAVVLLLGGILSLPSVGLFLLGAAGLFSGAALCLGISPWLDSSVPG
jgi:hypothetical protein